jgi:hypothetical protein
MASLIIRPGSRVRLKGQDDHVPDFYVVRCDRDSCWIRQQDWGSGAQLHVRFTQLLVPDGQLAPVASSHRKLAKLAAANRPAPPDNVIYIDSYRRRKAR